MSLHEQEGRQRRRWEAAESGQAPYTNGGRVLTFAQWCTLNAFSKATGRRLIKAGDGPRVLQLSPRRIGIRENDNAAWQAARVR